MAVIVHWADVETAQMRLFIKLMGGPGDRAVKVFLALNSRGTRIAAINAVASELHPDKQALLKALLAISKSKLRDRIAHWTWSYSSDVQGKLVITDPRAFAKERTDRSDALVYELSELAEEVTSYHHLAGLYIKLQMLIDPPAEDPRQIHYSPSYARNLH